MGRWSNLTNIFVQMGWWTNDHLDVCLVNLEARRMRRSTDMAQSKVIMHARCNIGDSTNTWKHQKNTHNITLQ